MKLNNYILLALLFFITSCNGCKNRNERSSSSETKEKIENNGISSKKAPTNSNEIKKIKKALFFLENSGSLKGYVNGGDTDFKTSLTSLANLPDLDESEKIYYHINGIGDNCKLDYIGNNPNDLENGMKRNHYNESDSDLTRMFELALDSASNGNVVFLVTDGLYDVGETDNPKKALEREVEKTQTTFRNKLRNSDVQTIVLKCYSEFDGAYYFASKKGSKEIEQQRPFYIFLFGEDRQLNIFNEEIFNERIKGYSELARFLKLKNYSIPYEVTNLNRRGSSFKKNFNNRNILTKAEPFHDRFQFAFAVDFSSLPFSPKYYLSKRNYSINDSTYSLTEVRQVTNESLIGINLDPDYLLTLTTLKNPYVEVILSLKNITPKWIEETNINNEEDIADDTIHTFGFSLLVNAISGAYYDINNTNTVTDFKFKITR